MALPCFSGIRGNTTLRIDSTGSGHNAVGQNASSSLQIEISTRSEVTLSVGNGNAEVKMHAA